MRSWNPRFVVFAVGLLALAVAASGCGAIASSSGGAAAKSSEYPSFDIGAAVRAPASTGKTRVFDLVAREADWEIAPGVTTRAITYNGQVPGPEIRVTEGDTVRVTLKNELAKATTIHWHGLHVPVSQDGVVPFSQSEIAPGQSFTYEFTASHAGTFMYHSHVNAVEQIDRGLYGTFIIERAQPSPTKFDREFTMMLGAWNTNADSQGADAMAGMAMNYNFFTINGKAFPLAPPWTVKKGELIRVRIINISNLVHPMHLHGHDFTVVAKDGEPIRPEAQITMNTLSVNAGETYEVVLRADNPGVWIWHCHELHHTENNGVEPGGLIQVLTYEGQTAVGSAGDASTATATPMPANMPGMKH